MFEPHPSVGGKAAYHTGCLALFVATGVILAALAFEHIGGYVPCPLCLQQRYAYYAAIPLLFAALVLVTTEQPRMAALLFALVALAFLANAGLGIYHAGAEWKFWAGPQGCTGISEAPATVGNLLEGLEQETGARCDEPQWRFAGLSFAGWNVVMSALLAFGAAKAARLSARHD
ncbi:MAG: disulfide bond formation protein B [Hyphomicrobium sp.]